MLRVITLPNSKSLIIRKLMIDYVLTGTVGEVSSFESDDVMVVQHALQRVRERHPADDCTVVDVHDCGAAYRFMMALLAVSEGRWLLTGSQRLLERPIEELVSVLRTAGGCVAPTTNGWLIDGRALRADTLSVDCRRSSQFASALLLIAPKLGLKELRLVPEVQNSVSYVNMTRNFLPWPVAIPGIAPVLKPIGGLADWSSALFVYSWSLLHPKEECFMPNLTLSSVQGDSVVAEWFEELGVVSVQESGGVRVRAVTRPGEKARIFDVADHPDVVPVMAALACLLAADFTFVHTRNLTFKESNRSSALKEQLSRFGYVDCQEDSIRIKGRDRALWPRPPYGFKTYNDHRLAMSFLLFGADAELDSTDCLRKSWGDRYQEVLKMR